MTEDEIKKDIEKLREEIQKRKDEIDQIKKSIGDLNTKIQEKRDAETAPDLKSMANQVSDLFNSAFNILGISGGTKDKGSIKGGLLDLINSLSELSDKTESFHREFDLAGKKGVVEYRISARPLKSHIVGRERHYQVPPRRIVGLTPDLQTIPKMVEERETMVDITEDDDELTVFMEAPGLSEADISVDIEQNKLIVNLDKERTAIKEIPLPKNVEKTGIRKEYRNGILEIKIKKAKQ